VAWEVITCIKGVPTEGKSVKGSEGEQKNSREQFPGKVRTPFYPGFSTDQWLGVQNKTKLKSGMRNHAGGHEVYLFTTKIPKVNMGTEMTARGSSGEVSSRVLAKTTN